MKKLLETFTRTNWDGLDLPDRLILAADSPTSGLEVAEELESFLCSQKFKSRVTEETSEAFHQNIVGIEGWLLDFTQHTFTRLDDFNIRWLTVPVTAKTHLVRIASFEQALELFTHRHGSVVGKKFNV